MQKLCWRKIRSQLTASVGELGQRKSNRIVDDSACFTVSKNPPTTLGLLASSVISRLSSRCSQSESTITRLKSGSFGCKFRLPILRKGDTAGDRQKPVGRALKKARLSHPLGM